MRRAAEVLGYACVTVRHLIDPEAIVLGGGVIEACSDFIMPIVENIVGATRCPAPARAAACCCRPWATTPWCWARSRPRKLVGRSPFKKRFSVTPSYPEISRVGFGEITVGRETYSRDIYISVSGKVKKRDESLAKELYGSAHVVGPKSWKRFAAAGPRCCSSGRASERRSS